MMLLSALFLAALVWGAAGWLAVALPLAGVLLVLLAWGYWRAGATPAVRTLAVALKLVAIAILALCLLEPLLTSNRARPGANLFVVLADNSQSMTLRGKGTDQTRAEQVKSLLPSDAKWLATFRQVFDLRQYAFDTQLKSFVAAEELDFAGGASNLGSTLERITRRYQGRPLAGILLMTDGSATDMAAITRFIEQANGSAKTAGGPRVPPIYPVLLGGDEAADDVSVGQVMATQTSFEDAPVTITAQVAASGYKSKALVANLLDESGKSIETQTITAEADGRPISVRFRVRPEQSGVSFYRIAVAPQGKDALPPTTQSATADTDEATLANNSRLVAVDRGQGPYRVLYVGGRPNWEFKFLQRSLQFDPQVQLLALLRIAKREPKFTFLGRGSDGDANPLFRGFDPAEKDAVETYDQPVLVRIGTTDAHELRGGFPKTAEELFGYHAIVLDDLEAEFLTQDQMQLVKDFVRQRGGGLLMLGGQESFKNGKYDRTPIGDVLPVYVDPAQEGVQLPADARYRLQLTREGLLEPWVRLRSDEDAERKRIDAMPPFETVNPIRGIKPGATVLATAQIEGGASVPALVEQRFGQGRVGAMLIGDVWRWGLRRPADQEDDMAKSWRQTIRRLVADVPERVSVTVASAGDGADEQDGTVRLRVVVRDPAHAPLDNGAVTVKVTTPDGKAIDLTAEASPKESGVYEAPYVPRMSGAYRVQALATAADGSDAGKAATGWTSEPAAYEFRDLRPNRAILETLARATGGQTVEAANIESFVATLPTRHAEITEPHIRLVWHQPWVFALAIGCLCAEWGLRRWKGMP